MEEGFGSVRDLYEKARKVDVGIALKRVSTWMTEQKKNAPFPKYEFQVDLMDVTLLLRDVGFEMSHSPYRE